MKRLLLAVIVLLAGLLGVAVARALVLPSRQLRVTPVAALVLDDSAALSRLAGAIRIPTVSHQAASEDDTSAFAAMTEYLAVTYPRLHGALTREAIGARGLLFTWKGSDSTLKPLVLVAHLDVVPVEPGTDARWTHPPFGGVLADGFVWGRGSFDDKGSAIAICEAIERLVAQDTKPRRTVLLAFGLDEEVGGQGGAQRIAMALAERHVRAAMVLDEGGAVLVGGPLPVAKPVALIGIAEKGYLTLALSTTAVGGHSSMPPKQTAIGVLGAAVAAIESHPSPGSLRGPSHALFDYLAPEMPLLPKVLFANLWLSRPLIERQLAASASSNAMLRTTAAATVFTAGTKDNVLPSAARVLVNFRTFPGETIAAVTARVRTVVNDERVTIAPIGEQREASAVSPIDSTFTALQRTITGTFADVVVAPYLVVGGTDASYYTRIADHVYRFLPIRIPNADLAGMHGTNERVSTAAWLDAVRFYSNLVGDSTR